MVEKSIPKFTCLTCGEHQLVVSHTGILNGLNSESWREWGPLKDDHHWQFEYKEKIEASENEEEEVQKGDFGEFIEDDSDSSRRI